MKATRQLLALLIRQNGIEPEDVCSAILSTTADLDAEFPALAARQLGWIDVALMCVHELDVPGSLRRCIRVLLHWNTGKAPDEIVHVHAIDGWRSLDSLLLPVDEDEHVLLASPSLLGFLRDGELAIAHNDPWPVYPQASR